MLEPPSFALVLLADLHAHEEVANDDLDGLVQVIRREGMVREPLLVAAGALVILNGHHRYRALLALGATRAPCWLVDYEDPRVTLDRWTAGPPITKEEVVERGRQGRLFPPKTTRHRVAFELPSRPTPLAKLGAPPVATGPTRSRPKDP